MCGTSVLSCIMTMIFNFTKQIFAFPYDPCSAFVSNFIFFKIIFIACFLKNPQNFFMQSLPLYTSCLFSMLLSKYIVDIEKLDGICLLTFLVDKFRIISASINLFFDKPKICINIEWCFIRFLVLIKF